MFKTKIIGALALTVLTGLGATGVYATSAEPIHTSTGNQAIHASQNFAAKTDSKSAGVMSRIDENKNVWCSEDNGSTWIPEAEFNKAHPIPVYKWWTYDGYKAWLEQEKITLQQIADEKAVIETSEGKFLWTQELTNQLIAEYEQRLKDIKNGLLVSKSVDVNTDFMASYNPKDIITTRD